MFSKDDECSSKTVLKSDEFEFSIDALALDLTILKNVNKMRISKINRAGQWSFDKQENIFDDSFIQLRHQGASYNAEMLVKGRVEALESVSRPTKMICTYGNKSVVYVNFLFRKVLLKPGTYSIVDNTFLLTPEGVVLVNLPFHTKKLSYSQATETDFDPKTLYFDSSFLTTVDRQTK